MNWNSPAEFFAMGGYGLYVWGSFGVCAVTLALEPLLVHLRHKAIAQRLRRTAQADRLDQES
ncbi:MAG: heme exporter protein CcmD [Rhodoferax sp.]|nr:heme exporter protein CcmD [Rhodoferax sp.]